MRGMVVFLLASGSVLVGCGDDGGAPGDAGSGDGGSSTDGATSPTDSSAIDSSTDGGLPDTDGSLPVDDASVADPRTSLSGPLGGGTRIRVEVVTSGGGPETVIGYFDTTRDEPCFFGVASDGVVRCLPGPSTSVSMGFYGDAGCTESLYLHATRGGCDPPAYVHATATDMCPRRTTTYSVVAPLADPTSMYQRNAMGMCEPATPVSGTQPYTLAEIDPAELASATVVELVRTADLVVEVLETEGGARAFHRIASAAGETCSPRRASDDVDRCMPVGISVGASFADASCTIRLGIVAATAECAPPTHAIEGTGACDEPVTVHDVTGAHAGTSYRVSSTTGACIAGSPSLAYATLGGIAAPDQFPATPLEEGPAGRLIERRYAIGDDYGYRKTLFDAVLGADCQFLPDRNGDLRCIPFSNGVIVNPAFYRDSGCALPLVSVGGNLCPGPYAVRRITSDCEPTRYDVVTVGARFTGTLYQRSGTFCTRPTRPSEFGLAFFRPGDPVAPEGMVLGTRELR